MQKAGEVFPDNASLKQKLTYLNALFDAVEKEQASLLKAADPEKVVTDMQRAERCLQQQLHEGDGCGGADEEQTLTVAIDLLEPYKEHTKLLDPLLSRLHEQRCEKRNHDDWAGILVDAEACLALQCTTDPVRFHKLRAKALQRLGRTADAKEALGKAVLMQPQDTELQELMEALDM